METLSQFDFFLPEELIATTAIQDRGASRLLVLRNSDDSPCHDYFKNIDRYLKPGDVLVINNTKVRKARIVAYKKTGGRVEILLVRPLKDGNWAALINGKGPFLPGTTLALGSLDSGHVITIIGRQTEDARVYDISCDTDLGVYAELSGELPLPPYFRRQANEEDEIRYQTIFAKELGAVAAPTAGLHFTDELLNHLTKSGIDIVETTLHVGPGTFLPIRTENIADHKMHSEHFHMDERCANRLNQAKSAGNRIIPVGSTAMRVLEQVMQWAHDKNDDKFFSCHGETAKFIRPGYRFLACDAIVTNFHLPRSTLLLLVSAVVGRERILQAYEEAIGQKYRFFSYGDACFFEIRK